MKLDAKNDPAIREFEDWVKDELHGKLTEQTGKCVECGGPSGEGYQQHKATCSFAKQNYNPLPAPRAGERERDKWRVEHFTKDGADEWMVVTGIGRTVALSNVNDSRLAEAEMRQIAHEHNQYSTLVEQRDRAVNALKQMLSVFAPYANPDTEQWREEVEAYDEAQAVLTTIEQGVKNAGEGGQR